MKSFVQWHVFSLGFALIFLTSCFREGEYLVPPEDQGKAKLVVESINSFPESTSVQFQISLNKKIKQDLVVRYSTEDGSAIAGLDYTPISGTLTIPSENTTALITVPVIDDALVEETETFSIVISSEEKLLKLDIEQAEAEILDNDIFPILSISTESELESSDITFTFTTDKTYPEDMTFNYNTSDNTASDGDDYTAASGSLTIPSGSNSVSLTINVLEDTLDENDENFYININSPTNVIIPTGSEQSTATIQDNDGTPNLDVADVSAAEGAGSLDFNVSIPTSSALPISFDWQLVDQSATSNDDFIMASGSASIPAGSTSVDISASIVDDALYEASETFQLNISNPVNAMLGTATGTATITDNDPIPSLSIADLSVTENNTANLTVTLSSVAGRDISFDYLTTDGSATMGGNVDYTQVTATTITILEGDTTATLPVSIQDDAIDEPDENFSVSIQNPVNATIATASATVTITDNDNPPTVDFSTASFSINEANSGPYDYRVRINFANASRASDLVDFPVLLRLSSSNIDYSKTNDDGSNIRFYDADNTTPLDYEIEKWDEAGESHVWVKVPQIDGGSNTDFIYLYYGDTSLTDGQNPTAVWSNGYVGVYHLNESSGDEIYDSTGSYKHGYRTGAASSAGQIGNAFYFNGNDMINLGFNDLITTDTISVCSWVSQSSSAEGMAFALGTNYFLGIRNDRVWTGAYGNNVQGITAMTTSTWHYICGTYEPGDSKGYLNGVMEFSTAKGYGMPVTSMRIGNSGKFDNTHTFTGWIDQVQISNVERSADWISAEYASMTGSLTSFTTENFQNVITITMNLSGISGYDLTIPYEISGTSSSADHNAVNGNFTIPAESGTTDSFNVEIYNDLLVEGSETLIISFGTLSNASLGTITTETVSIEDDDESPIVNLSVSQNKIYESSWWDANWLHRKKINIDTSLIKEDLNDFTFLVKLDSSNIDYAKTLNAGEDIRFVSMDGTQVLNYEIEKWDESASSYVWVKVPFVANADTESHFYMYYNNSAASDGQNSNASWDKDFKFIAHFSDTSDSSSYNNSISANLSPTPEASLIGDGYSFSGAGDGFFISNFVSSPWWTESKSICFWNKSNDITSDSDTIALRGESDKVIRPLIIGAKSNYSFLVWGTSNLFELRYFFVETRWDHICTVYNNTGKMLVYFNGLPITNVNSTYHFNQAYLDIGWSSVNSKHFNGSLDELKISNSVRSTEWIRASYLNESNQLISLSSEEAYTANDSYTVTVKSSRVANANIDVPILVAGSSSNPEDHNLAATTISILSGNTEASHSFNIVDDATNETDESIEISLGSLTNATAGQANTASITIVDNDTDPIVNFTQAGVSVDEGVGSVTVQVQLNKNAESPLSLPFTVSGTADAASDHDLVDASFDIASGTNTASISFNITQDLTDEYNEYIDIQLGSLDGLNIGQLDTYRVYIIDDDTPSVISIADDSASETTGTYAYTISLDKASGKEIWVDLSTTDGTASSSPPFKFFNSFNLQQSSSTHIVIPAGSSSVTTDIDLLDNNYYSGAKDFQLTLANAKNASMGTSTATFTITDDEVLPTVDFNLASQSIEESGTWWDASYSNRLKLTFNNSNQAENLDNFPVMVKLNSSRIDYTNIKDAGEDIRFIDANGMTELSYEIEVWNESGDSIIWVKVPRIDASSNTDHIWLYYNNSSATDNQNPTGVWNSDIAGVLHMNGDNSDASSNQVSMTDTNVSYVSGPFSNAASFLASSNSRMLADSATTFSPSDDYSVELWIKPTSTNANESMLIHKLGDYEWKINNNFAAFQHGTPWQSVVSYNDVNYTQDSWQHLIMVFDKTAQTVKHYINGELYITASENLSGGYSGASNFCIACAPSTSAHYSDFDMDEFRFYTKANSEAWAKAQYLTQADKFISFAPANASIETDILSDTDITINYTVSGTSTNPEDHDASSGSIVLPAFSKSVPIPIQIVDDSTPESNESLIFTLDSASTANLGSTTVHTTTIIDDDGKVNISIDDISVTEAGTAVFTVSLNTTDTGSISVDFTTVNGSANSSTDYTSNSGSLTFAAGETTKTISIVTTDDSLDEYNESAYIVLSNPTGNGLITDSLGKLSIVDDDAPVEVEFSVASATEAEADAPVTVTATLSAVSGKTVRLTFTVSGTAGIATDHDASDNQITISAGATSSTYTFNLIDDTTDENDETIILTATSPVNSTLATNTVHTISITDDDDPPSISFASTSDTEGNSINITASLSAVSEKTVLFDWETSDNTALNGIDYLANSGSSISIAPGDTTATVSVSTLDDKIYEAAESFNVSFSSISNASNGGGASITINDNESLPSIQFEQASSEAFESEYANVYLVLSSESTVDITVNIDIDPSSTATAGVDHNLVATSITIPAGKAYAKINLQLVDDADSESTETIIINLSSPSNASLGGQTQHSFSLLDDGQIPSPSPIYTGNSNWMDYVKNDETNKTSWKQSNDACDASSVSSMDQCIHGAEYFQVDLGGSYPNCGSLEIRDALDLFYWTCEDVTGSAIFYSMALQKYKSLKDIVSEFNTLRENAIVLYDSGTKIAASERSPWWTNTISLLPDNSSSSQSVLNTSGNIYVLNNNQNSLGYSIEADKVAVLLKENVQLNMLASSQNCSSSTGQTTPVDATCIITAGSKNYLWIEGGTINGAELSTDQIGINIVGGNFHQLKWLNVIDNSDANIHLGNSAALNAFFVLSSGAKIGAHFNDLSYSRVENIQTANNDNEGLKLENANSLYVQTIQSANNGADGISISGSTTITNSFSEILSSSNAGSGISISSAKNIVSFATLTNNASHGLILSSGNQFNLLHQIASINNAQDGVNAADSGTNKNQYSQILSSLNSGNGIQINSSENLFTSNLILGSNGSSDCFVVGGTNPGLVNATCANQSLSDASLTSSVNPVSSFLGKQFTNDPINTAENAGLAPYASNLSFSFQSRFNVWGLDGSDFANSNHQGRCNSGNCRVWNWSLADADTVLKNSSDDGSTAGTFTSSAACPAGVSGNRYVNNYDGTENIGMGGNDDGVCDLGEDCTNNIYFLENAIESSGDLSGNDNGLCESGEACFYAPNIGFDQNQEKSQFSDSCVFSNGKITNVILSSFE